MNADYPAVAIHHNVAASRYETSVEGQLAFAEYSRSGNTIVFTHTWTPPELRGRGLAEKIVRTALEDARRENLRVVPRCSYVARFIERHREYAPLLGEDRSRSERGPSPH